MGQMLEAARSGDTRRALEQLRDELAAAFELAPPTVCAQIAAQYRATLSDIASLPALPVPATEGVVTIADAKAKRAARQSAASPAAGAKTGGRKRGG